MHLPTLAYRKLRGDTIETYKFLYWVLAVFCEPVSTVTFSRRNPSSC